MVSREDPVVNALAVMSSAFFPGLGHAMKGQFSRGALLFLAFLVSVVLIILLIGIILAPAVWGYTLYDCYRAPIIPAGEKRG